MKIVFVAPYYAPSVGGVQRYVEQLVRALEKNHQIVIITTQSSHRTITKESRKNVTIYRLPTLFRVANTPFHPRWKHMIKTILERENPDILNTHAPVPLLADVAAKQASKLKIPIVASYHSGSMRKGSFLVDSLIGFYESHVLPKTLKRAEKIIAIYPAFVKKITGNSNISFVPPGIDTSFFTPQPHVRKQFDLLFAGRIERSSAWKGLDTLLQAVSYIKQTKPDISLAVAGDGDALATYKQLSEKLNISDNVTFLGGLKPEQLRATHASSRVFVLPSKTESESFGIVLAEAMASGMPAVASDVGGVPALLEHNVTGRLVPPGDATALAKTLYILLADKHTQHEFGLTARRRVEQNFSLSQQVARNEELFAAVVDQRRHFSIVQATAHFPPFLGGMEQRIKELSEKLAGRGHSVTVLTSDQANHAHTAHPAKRLTIKFLRSIELAHTAIIPGLARQLFGISRDTIVHVHIAHAYVPEIVSWVCRLRHIPYIAHVRLDVPASGIVGKFLLPTYKRIFLKSVLNHAQHVIVLTEDYKELMHELYEIPYEKITVIPNATEFTIAAQPKRIHNSTVKLLFVGRLAHQKNVPLLLHGLRKAIDQDNRINYQLRIVGEGELRSELETLTTKLGLESHVQFVGALRGQDLERAYEGADVFVLTSSHESFGTVLIEAMAKGLPVIATRIDAVKNTIVDKKNGLLIQQTPDALASALLHITHDTATSMTYSANNLQKASEYKWDRVLDSTERVYRNIRPIPLQPRRALWLYPLSLIAAWLSFQQTMAYGLTAVLWFVVIASLGYLWLSAFNFQRKVSVSSWLSIVTGVAISSLIVFGLILNYIGVLLHIPTLTPPIIISSFMVLYLALLTLHCLRTQNTYVPRLTLRTPQKFSAMWSLIPLIFPLISVLGAARLNEGYSNAVAISSLVAIIIYQIATPFLYKRRTELAYCINLFSVALALILSMSMRSEYLVGFDINQEFRVFQTVLQNGEWLPRTFVDNTYNACLSITILPALMHTFIPLSPEYIFKFVMQFIAAMLPIAVFSIARQQLKNNNELAFVAALLFTIQAQFFLQLPALVRQQTAWLMFALIINVISTSNMSRRSVAGLVGLFGATMVLSHYSSSYVSIGIFVIAGIISLLLRFISRRALKRTEHARSWYLTPRTILFFLFCVIMWYGVIVGSSGNVVSKVTTSFSSLSEFVDNPVKSLKTILNITPFQYDSSTIQKLSHERKNIPKSQAYPDATQATEALSPAYANPTPVVSLPQKALLTTFETFVPLFVKLLLIVGIFYSIYLWYRGFKSSDEIAVTLASCIVIAAFVALPGLSDDYNFERLYQQVLIILSAVFVIGIMLPLRRFRISHVTTVLIICAMAYLASTSTLLRQTITQTGEINLNNKGDTYDRYYATKAEVQALQWLADNYQNHHINFDRYSIIRAQAYTSIPINRLTEGVLPSDIGKDNLVFESAANRRQQVAYDTYHGKLIMYQYPQEFLDEHKEIVYDNGVVRIYQ